MQANRQTILLGLLAVVAVWALWYALGGDSRPGGGTRDVGRSGPAGELPPVIELAERARERDPFNPSGGRNLFAYGEPKRLEPVGGPAGRSKRGAGRGPDPIQTKAPKVAPPPPPPPRELAPPKPTPPPINFKFVGYLGPQDGLIGVFRVNTPDGELIVLAGEGEELAENFRVHRIGYEEVEIGYTKEPFLSERKVLPMGGQS